MKEPFTIDIVIVAFNEEAEIANCLEGIRGQGTHFRSRVFVQVDEKTTDRTISIARQLGAEVELASGSVADLRNSAVALGSGQFVVFLDAHCVPRRNWLVELVRKIVSTGAAAVQGRILYKYKHPLHPRWEAGTLSGGQNSFHHQTYAWLKSGNLICRRDAFLSVGGFDGSCKSLEDVDLSWRLLASGQPLAFAPLAVVEHRDRSTFLERMKRWVRYGYGSALLGKRFKTPTVGLSSVKSLESLLYWLGAMAGTLCGRLAPGLLAPRWAEIPWSEHRRMRLRRDWCWWFAPATESGRQDEVVLTDGETRLVLDPTGAKFWCSLMKGKSPGQIVEVFCRKTRVEESVVKHDLLQLLQQLERNGVVVEVSKNEDR